MPEYLNVYVENERYDDNPFIDRKPDLSELPKFDEVKDKLPEPFWDGHPDSIEAYYKAWRIAFGNLGKPTAENGFVSPYIDAAFNGHIFMWDSCFMLMFGKYGDKAFSFQRTLDNFYCKQEPDGFIGREYSEENGESIFYRLDPVSTGPEIMDWCEWQYYKCFGDRKRLADVYYPLLTYHRWMRMFHTWRDGSYWASGFGCGMDNLPRRDKFTGFDDFDSGIYFHSFMSWVDANFQAILSCENLLNMAHELGEDYGVEELEEEKKLLIGYVNEKLWSKDDAYYYDLRRDGSFLTQKTLASYWGLLAGAVPEDRADSFIAHLENEKEFKRPHRVPTLSADSGDYDPDGGYWNGGVWAPTVYMVLRGLTRYGRHGLAAEIAENHYENVMKVFNETGTFWENYAPESAAPGRAQKDFVGWTGLVPITVFIEYILGITVESEKDLIIWRVSKTERHGIKKLSVDRDSTVDLECAARSSVSEKPAVTVKCDKDITVKVIYDGGKSFTVGSER
ncbi:MAG: glycoside hydrolase [Clostridia bacterium]|nr:glycoside hydrolase [Clostridia bacterium]